jgi:hypothetical protein
MSKYDLKGAIARGGQAAEQMQQENSFSGSKFEKVNWFKLGDRESMFVRFLDDHSEWLTVLQHPFAPTRPVPEEWTPEQKKGWPTSFSPVCRKTKQFVQFFPDGCWICDGMHQIRPNDRAKDSKYHPQVRLWARGVQREEVRVTEENQAQYPDQVTAGNQHIYPGEEIGATVLRPLGTVLGYRDIEDEVDELDSDNKPTGKKIVKKRIIVFNMAWKNFFGPLQGYADVYTTVLDRDYRLTRKGKDKDTDYDIVPLNPAPRADGSILHMGKSRELVNGQPTDRLLREVYFEDGPDLIQLIEDRVDDDLYDRFFDDRKPVPERRNSSDEGSSTPSTPAAQPSSPPATAASSTPAAPPANAAPPAGQTPPANGGGSAADAKARLAAMRARVTGDHPAPEQSQDGSAPQDQPAQPAAVAGPVSFN